jgi:hypothetical protein
LSWVARVIELRALLRAKEGGRLPETLNLGIAHPTRAGFDQKVTLRSEGGGVYAGGVLPFRGRWHITLEDDRQEWRLMGAWVTEQQPVFRLTTSAGQRLQRRGIQTGGK